MASTDERATVNLMSKGEKGDFAEAKEKRIENECKEHNE
jgi:hypothetical protein